MLTNIIAKKLLIKIVKMLQVEEEDDDDNDGFFVPHGHLSEGEGCEDDEEEVHKHQPKLIWPLTPKLTLILRLEGDTREAEDAAAGKGA